MQLHNVHVAHGVSSSRPVAHVLSCSSQTSRALPPSCSGPASQVAREAFGRFTGGDALCTSSLVTCHPSRSSKQRQQMLQPVAAQPPHSLSMPLDRDLEQPLPAFDSIKEALADVAAGKFVVVLDDENRENEGDLIIAADRVTTADMHYMVEHTSGVICISMEGQDMQRLRLPQMVRSDENEESMYTAFTVTVDLREGTTTGISASDRAKTIRRMAEPDSRPEEFRRPGHIFPLRARPGGVLTRPGHTEAAVDLARLAGCYPAGVLCELVNRKDGSMARTPDLLAFAKREGLKCITIADLARYRLKHESLVRLVESSQWVSTQHGPMVVHTFQSALDGTEHLVFTAGEVAASTSGRGSGSASSSANGKAATGSSNGSGAVHRPQDAVPVWVHSERTVSDLLGLPEPSSSSHSLSSALQRLGALGSGAVVCLRSAPQPGQIAKEVRALGVTGEGALPPSIVDYGLAAQMLRALGLTSCSLLWEDDGRQAQALQSCGLALARQAQAGSQQQRHANGAQLSGSRA